MDANVQLVNKLVDFFTSLSDKSSIDTDFIDKIPKEVLCAIDCFGDLNSQNFYTSHPEGVSVDDMKAVMCGHIYLGWKLSKEIQRFELDSMLGSQE